jgi:hypothetical protein
VSGNNVRTARQNHRPDVRIAVSDSNSLVGAVERTRTLAKSLESLNAILMTGPNGARSGPKPPRDSDNRAPAGFGRRTARRRAIRPRIIFIHAT